MGGWFFTEIPSKIPDRSGGFLTIALHQGHGAQVKFNNVFHQGAPLEAETVLRVAS